MDDSAPSGEETGGPSSGLAVSGVATADGASAAASRCGAAGPAGAAAPSHTSAAVADSAPRLRVAASCIPGAGAGLFTLVPVAAGEVVAVYDNREGGGTLDAGGAARLRDKRYLMRLGPGVYVNAGAACVARYINDARNPAKTNVAWRKLPAAGRADVVAARAIAAREELFADYGRLYWLRDGGTVVPTAADTTLPPDDDPGAAKSSS